MLLAVRPPSALDYSLGMRRAYVGRQPIFDRNREVFGYELLYRDGSANRATFTDAHLATSNVILNSFLEIGIERVAGNLPVFVNFTREYLLGQHPLPSLRGRLFIEILEDVRIDDELIQAVRGLRAEGYGIALDDFVYSKAIEPLIECAQIVKLDLLAIGRDGVAQQLEHLRRFPVQILAEKVDNHEDYAFCRDLGFAYFQGYFLCRPEVLEGAHAPANRLALVQLLARLYDPKADITEIVNLVQADVGLSYRLMRCINSPLYSLRREIAHVREAVTMLGLAQVQKWVALLVLSNGSNKPHALLSTALLRAKMCELLARAEKHPAPDAMFTAGLFSVLDALLDMPMAQILESLPLSADVSSALAGRPSRATELLTIVRAQEAGELDHPLLLALGPGLLVRIWIEALEWAHDAASLARRS